MNAGSKTGPAWQCSRPARASPRLQKHQKARSGGLLVLLILLHLLLLLLLLVLLLLKVTGTEVSCGLNLVLQQPAIAETLLQPGRHFSSSSETGSFLFAFRTRFRFAGSLELTTLLLQVSTC